MDRAKRFVALIAGFGKLVAAVVGLGAIGGALTGLILWGGDRASAREVTTQFSIRDHRLDVVEVKVENEIDWRRAEWQQLQEIAKAVRAPVLSPPPSAPLPISPKERP